MKADEEIQEIANALTNVLNTTELIMLITELHKQVLKNLTT